VQVAQKLAAHCLVECGTYASPALFVVISDDEPSRHKYEYGAWWFSGFGKFTRRAALQERRAISASVTGGRSARGFPSYDYEI